MLPKYKDIVELMKKGSTLEAQEQILSLRESALELQEENILLREKNQELKIKIKSLENNLNSQEEVEFKDGFYYIKEPKDGQANGPFCSKCYSDENKLILVSKTPLGFQDFGKYECPKCGAIAG